MRKVTFFGSHLILHPRNSSVDKCDLGAIKYLHKIEGEFSLCLCTSHFIAFSVERNILCSIRLLNKKCFSLFSKIVIPSEIKVDWLYFRIDAYGKKNRGWRKRSKRKKNLIIFNIAKMSRWSKSENYFFYLHSIFFSSLLKSHLIFRFLKV